MESCTLNTLISSCDDVLDYWKDFVPDEIARGKKNLTDQKRYNCVKDFIISLASLRFHDCDCPFQCNEIAYTVRWNRIHQDWDGYWRIFFKFPNFTLKKVTEVADYTIFDLLAELGGYLGLFSGVSALSLIEVAILLIVSVAVFFKKRQTST